MDTTTASPTLEQRLAILCIGLEAALVAPDARERHRLRKWPERLRALDGTASTVPVGQADAAVARLTDAGARRLAFDTALGACSADGLRSDDETRFLARLGPALGLSHPDIVSRAAMADALTTMALTARPPDIEASTAANGNDAVLRAAVTCGALGFTGQPVAAIAIIPLQLKLLHRIGRADGVEMDHSRARTRLLTSGDGLAYQYLDVVAAQIDPGRPHQMADPQHELDSEHPWAAAQCAFAHTFAIGELARRERARGLGEPWHPADYGDLVAEGRDRSVRHVDEVARKAREIDLVRLPAFVRAQ